MVKRKSMVGCRHLVATVPHEVSRMPPALDAVFVLCPITGYEGCISL